MNPEADDKLPSEEKANENQDNEQQQSDQAMSEDEVTNRQQSQQQSAATNSSRPNPAPENVRAAAKELVERYFYQLLRGCGNPKCSNVNCASSGKIAPMTANEMAAKAIQLFLGGAKLCEFYNEPPKVNRTDPHHESPTSSHQASESTNLVVKECVGGCISSGSSSSTSSISTGSNTDIPSCATEEMPLLVALGENTKVDQSTSPLSKSPDSLTPTLERIDYLNEEILDDIIESCKKHNNYERLVRAIDEVYSSIQKLSKSYKRSPIVKLTSTAAASKLQEILDKSPQELKKEDLRTLEGEHDKDEDSSCIQADEQGQDQIEIQDVDLNNDHASCSNSTERYHSLAREVSGDSDGGEFDSVSYIIEPMDEDLDDTVDCPHCCVDFESLKRVKEKLNALENETITDALNDNIILLSESMKFGSFYDWDQFLHCFIICFDMSATTSNRFADLEYLERSMPKLCQAAEIMPIKIQARLARIWSIYCKDQLQSFIQSLQQLITLRVILYEDAVQENTDIIAITKVLKIVFYANILAGEIDTYNPAIIDIYQESQPASSSTMGASANDDDDDIFLYNNIQGPYHPAFAEDNFEKELNISCMDCRVPFVPFDEFYNEPLSDAIQMDRDYLSYRNLSSNPLVEDNDFSFMMYSFILTPATKVVALYYDSRIRMFSELNSSIYSLLSYVGDGDDIVTQPNLKLKVRRENIVNDALIGLELVAMSNPKDLKKQLVVEFLGEQGIDEGGVSKEFFQLIVEEIFNPDFGMFIHQEDTNTMWFNSTPFENEAQFTLIGIILGLAIYNNIILAVNFPRVVYRKLMGGRGTFYDLKDWNPTLYRGLKSMLDYEENDMEEVFMQTFKITYKNVFDEVREYELKRGGGDIAVNQENKQEFVDLYIDYLLNKSIERQFKAFKRGFDMVTDESPLKLLFRPEEIELLVCGSRKFDFIELEISTEYEGGYTKDTQIIKDFWSIVHNLPEESKRKLLAFTTGSDRVPVGGLSRLKLLITRNGPDSDRLPTSHTCFNVLLLPEYSSKEKLEERLLKAINYSKGFGMS